MRNSLAFLVAGLVACGGPAKGPESPAGDGSGSGSGSKPMAPGDVSFEVPTQEIKGLLFEPEAMDLMRPGMPLVEAKKKTTVEKQRQAFDKTKDPVLKQAQAAILATMLYQQSKTAKGEEQTKLYQDARQVLRDAAQAAGDTNVDEVTLRLLGSYELLLADYPAAEKAWAGLVAKAPKDKELQTNKAWLAYSQLKQYKNAEALETVKAETPTDKTPELAYVTAWAKWRTGDGAGAWQAITTALKGWGGNPGKEAVERDVLLFAGRTDTKLDAAVAALTPLYGKTKEAQYELLAKLGLQAYQFAGRWTDGVDALERALKSGANIPPNDLPVIRYQEMDYTVRLDDPEKAAKYGIGAVEALPACGTKCSDKDKASIVLAVNVNGRLFHVLYATAHDDRYYQPAHDIYQATVMKISDDKARTEAQQYADTLEKSFKTMRAGVGTHDKSAIGALLGRFNQEIQACYEQGLASDSKLSGNLTLELESDQDGAIKGASTEPKAGMQGMALVAQCVENRAKAWRLPKRAQAGVTRIKITYSMSQKK